MKNNKSQTKLYLRENRTLFIGQHEKPIIVSTGAATFILSLNEPIRFKTNEMSKPKPCRSLLLKAGTSVVLNFGKANVLNFTLDPTGLDLCRLSQHMEQEVGSALLNVSGEEALINQARNIVKSTQGNSELFKILMNLLALGQCSKSTQSRNISHKLDPRAKKVIDVIQDTTSENLSLSELASRANMSPSRLVQVFKQQTGLPVRRYRLWHRLITTAHAVGQGQNLTEAAVLAGFTDSSHFNRTFRSMLNIKPSDIFSIENPVQIVKPMTEYEPAIQLIS